MIYLNVSTAFLLLSANIDILIDPANLIEATFAQIVVIMGIEADIRLHSLKASILRDPHREFSFRVVSLTKTRSMALFSLMLSTSGVFDLFGRYLRKVTKRGLHDPLLALVDGLMSSLRGPSG